MSNEDAERFMDWVKARAPQPKREWVGLTEEERDSVIVNSNFYSNFWVGDAIDMVERILREKNGG